MAISGRQLRFRRGFPVIHPGTARLPRARSALAMTNLIASRRRMRAAKIANLQGAHNPQGARRIRKVAQPSTDAQSLRAPLAVVGAALFGREITGRFRISPSCALTGIRSLIVLLL